MTSISSIALTGLFLWTGAGVPTNWVSQPILSSTNKTQETISVRLTGYNAVPEQTDSDPTMTASGAFSNPDVIAARSRDLAETLPYGTVIVFETADKDNSCGLDVVDHLIGYRVVADAMHARKQNQVDIMFDMADTVQIGVSGNARKPTNPAVALGVCKNVSIRVVGKIEVKDIPATQAELARLVKHTFAVR